MTMLAFVSIYNSRPLSVQFDPLTCPHCHTWPLRTD